MIVPQGYVFREFAIADYDAAIALWRASEGIGVNESDSRAGIERFLERNPGLSLIVTDQSGTLVGTVLCGHDGRRGYLHHLAVAPAHRRRGIGRALVESCLARLRAVQIAKCSIFLYTHNAAGQAFWFAHGWSARQDLVVVQRELPSSYKG